MKTTQQQKGAAILLLALALLLIVTLASFMLLSANNVEKAYIQHRYQIKQAYANATEGLSYAAAKLPQKKLITTPSPEQTPAFSVNYQKSNFNSQQIITITSTGHSPNKKINRTITQEFIFHSLLSQPTLKRIATQAQLKLNADFSTDYSSKLGHQNYTVIFITQQSGSARVHGTTCIGSLQQPVILLVDGNLQLSQKSKIYGLLFTTRNLSLQDKAEVIGQVRVKGKLTIASQAKIIPNKHVLALLQQTVGYYAAIPGSWRDF